METEKNDIRNYGIDELSLIFLNDEGLYNILLRDTFDIVMEYVDEMFIYTEEQKDDLYETWQEHRE